MTITFLSGRKSGYGLLPPEGSSSAILMKASDSDGDAEWVDGIYGASSAEDSLFIIPETFRYPVGDVRRYGAIGNGVADDSSAIQEAISVMAASRGGIVSFPALKFNLGTTGISIPAGEHGIRLVGQASGFTNDEGPASTELSYSGSESAISIGGSGSRTDYCALENVAVNISSAASSASCLKTTRVQQFLLSGSTLLTTQSGTSPTGQTAWIMDGGNDFSAYSMWNHSKIRGDFTYGIVTQNGQNNAIYFWGGSVLQTCSGTPSGTIGFEHTVGDTSFIFGTDFDGWNRGVRIAGSRHTIIARFEGGGNTIDVDFTSTAANNFMAGGIFDPSKVVNGGSNNIVISTTQFMFTPGGRFGINSTPDHLFDVRDSALVTAQMKATDSNGVARAIVANGTRAHEIRCHTDGSGMIRDATGDTTKVMWDTNGTTVYTFKTDVVATASLPAAAASQDGRILIEDNGAGDRNIVVYAGGQRFRIDGGAAF